MKRWAHIQSQLPTMGILTPKNMMAYAGTPQSHAENAVQKKESLMSAPRTTSHGDERRLYGRSHGLYNGMGFRCWRLSWCLLLTPLDAW